MAVAPAEGIGSVLSAGKEIAKAVAPDLAEHLVASLEYNKFKEFLLKPHPGNTNRDLDKLIKGVLIRAVGFIRRLYIDRLKKEQHLSLWNRLNPNPLDRIETVLDNLEEDLKFKLQDPFEKEELEAILAGEPDSCFDQLTEYLFTVSGVETSDPEWQKLVHFFREQLPVMFDLAYKEALKDTDNEKAFKAFQIWILDEGLKSQKEILEGQERILEGIRELRADGVPTHTAEIVSAFESAIETESAKILGSVSDIFSQLYRIEEKLDKIAGGIAERTPRLVPHELNIIPSPGAEFIGREEDLKRLEDQLQSSSKVVLMNGLGGIGKTTLAKIFVQRKKSSYSHILWIDSAKQGNDLPEGGLQTSFTDIVAHQHLFFTNLKIPFNLEEEDSSQRFSLIMNALRNLPGKNLMVIDNADQELARPEIRHALPVPPNWQVLITSRQRLTGYSILPLDKLQPSEARELFLFYYPYPSNSKAIEKLLEAIDYHTLTIELFAKTLKEHYGAISVEQLSEKVRARELNDPDLQRKIETEHSGEETEVFLHLMLLFDLSGLSVRETSLLKQFTLLPPQLYEVHEQLAQWLQKNEPEERKTFNEAISSLIRKGWLQEVGNKVGVHRLVQEISYQSKLEWEEALPLVDSLISKLRLSLENSPSKALYSVTLAEKALEKCIKQFPDYEKVRMLKVNLHFAYRDMGSYSQALIIIDNLLKEYEAIKHQENFILCLVYKGILFKELGRYEEAISTLVPTLPYLEHNEYLLVGALSALGLAHRSLKQLEAARYFLELTLENCKRSYGDRHPIVSTSLSNLSTAYRDLQDYPKVKELLLEAISIDEEHYPRDHPAVMARRNNYALSLSDIGSHKEAAEIFESMIEFNTNYYGENHPLVAVNQANLGLEYMKLGLYEKAKPLFEKSLEIGEKIMGEDHDKIIDRRNSLIDIYFNLNDVSSMKKLLEKQLEIQIAKLGEEHITVAHTQKELGAIFLELRSFRAAKEKFKIARNIFLKKYGKNNQKVIEIEKLMSNISKL